jgi:two-component system alkaline phosphatase synthesis response regulator PhoP
MSHLGAVLVVEDHREVREMVRAILEQEGYPTTGASNGVQALDALHREEDKPRLILLDLMMPGMGGIELIDQLSNDETLASIPVVVMTAHPDICDKNRAQIFVPVVSKPLDCDELLAAVRKSCGAPRPAPRNNWLGSLAGLFGKADR